VTISFGPDVSQNYDMSEQAQSQAQSSEEMPAQRPQPQLFRPSSGLRAVDPFQEMQQMMGAFFGQAPLQQQSEQQPRQGSNIFDVFNGVPSGFGGPGSFFFMNGFPMQ